MLLYLLFFNVTPTTDIYTLSLHDALPISLDRAAPPDRIDRALALLRPRRGPGARGGGRRARRSGDRKSTRLNSSHPSISYAVFCLKKKIRKLDEKALAPDHPVSGSCIPLY